VVSKIIHSKSLIYCHCPILFTHLKYRYVLIRHLKQTEVIHPAPPGTKEIGKFRGESVYPRSSVVSVKTAENWMRSEGRAVKEGMQPLKFNKVRAGTVNRMRELEVLKDGLREAGEGSGMGSADGEVKVGDHLLCLAV
jgi:xeroderma pigmentosum group C-complementing protein